MDKAIDGTSFITRTLFFMKLSLLTYNIHKGFSSANQFSLHDMRNALANVNADIVCLQELQGEHRKHEKNITGWPEQEQLEFLADEFWPHSVYGKNVEHKHGDHGNGILSKAPIICYENIDISSGIFSSRGLLHAQLHVGQQTLHIMCTHLGLLKSERAEQYEELEQRIKEHVPINEALIIAGDFNDWLQQAEEHLCESLQLQEVFMQLQGKHAKSFPALKPVLSVDRIYYRGLMPLRCEILTAEPWDRLSDHVPLWFEFTL